MAFAQVHPGDLIQSQNLNQVVNALNGTSGDGQPVLLVALNDPNNYALTVQNLDPTNCRALLVLKNDGTTLLSAGCNGVTLGSPLTLAAGAQIPNANLGPDVARANLLTNGGFEIWQRGNGPFTGGSVYTADRWITYVASGDTFSITRDTTHGDNGAGVCMAVTYTRSTGGSQIQQVIEDVVQNRSRTFTFSVRVFQTVANSVRIGIYDSVNGFRYSPVGTTANAYQTLTLTAPIGATATNITLVVDFQASCTAYLDNAMLVVGTQPANYVPLHPADDLARCLRYFETIGDDGDVILGGLTPASPTSPTAFATVSFKARKAVTPTITFVGGAWTAVNITGGGPVINAVGRGSARLNLGSAGPASGTYYVASDTTHYITAESNP